MTPLLWLLLIYAVLLVATICRGVAGLFDHVNQTSRDETAPPDEMDV